MADTAKIFWSGRSQAVRLPKAFRIDADEVRIRKDGRKIVLEPIEDEWAWLAKMPGELDEDFVRATKEEMPQQERPELDDFFK